jgi:hypothetical protein
MSTNTQNNKAMIAAETRPMTALEDRKHPRLVSFENSNSWIKRTDEAGTLVIQAGYQENPGKMAHRDNENPIVVMQGQRPRWYGSIAMSGRHIPIHGQSKVETARESFAATLQPGDHQRDLTVVASHWDQDEFPRLQTALKGQYRVIRNGQDIQCTVSKVIPVLEGMGSYHAVSDQLKTGSTLLFELGFGTAEIFQIDSNGRVLDGRIADALGITTLVDAIAADPTIRGLLQDASGTVNQSLISAALMADDLGRVGSDAWSAIKNKYATEYLKRLQGYVRIHYADQAQGITNMVLTGGGAALLADVQPKVKQVFIVPDGPQTASVRGSYAHALMGV